MAANTLNAFAMDLLVLSFLIMCVIQLTGRLVRADDDDDDDLKCYYQFQDSRSGSFHYVHCQFGCCDQSKIECCPDPNADKPTTSVSKDNKGWLIALGVLAGVLVLVTTGCCIFGYYKHKVAAKMAVGDTPRSTERGQNIGLATISSGRNNAGFSNVNFLASVSAPPAYSKYGVTKGTEQPPPYTVIPVAAHGAEAILMSATSPTVSPPAATHLTNA